MNDPVLLSLISSTRYRFDSTTLSIRAIPWSPFSQTTTQDGLSENLPPKTEGEEERISEISFRTLKTGDLEWKQRVRFTGPDFIRKISLSMTAIIERPAVCPVVLSHENNSAQTRRTTV
jgi:hypothetical protein